MTSDRRSEEETLNIRAIAWGAALLAAAHAVAGGVAGAAEEFGGERFRTSIETKTTGKLSNADYRQVSVLGSEILVHLANATAALDVDDRKAAARHIDKALTLVGIIRQLLPVTETTTVVRDASGREVYRNTERSQDDLIPLYESLYSVEVVEPVVAEKKTEAALRGVKLSDADLVRTEVLLDLGYVARRLHRAKRLLDGDDADAARAELVLAQTVGVDLQMHEEDNPLVAAQAALRLAEQNLVAGRPEGAAENLKQARLQLETYRTLAGAKRAGEVKKLIERVTELEARVAEPGAVDEVRRLWNQVTAWLTRESGETRPTVGVSAD